MKTYAEQSEAKKFWNLKNKHTFYFNNHSQIFSLCLNFSLCHRKIFSLCLKFFPCVKAKFPVFSVSGKSKNQIPCFPCAVATLLLLTISWLHFCKFLLDFLCRESGIVQFKTKFSFPMPVAFALLLFPVRCPVHNNPPGKPLLGYWSSC